MAVPCQADVADLDIGGLPPYAAALLAKEDFQTDQEAQAAAACWHGVTWHRGHQRFRVVIRRPGQPGQPPRSFGQHVLLRKAVVSVAQILNVSVAQVLRGKEEEHHDDDDAELVPRLETAKAAQAHPDNDNDEPPPLPADASAGAAAGAAATPGAAATTNLVGSAGILGGSKFKRELAQFRALLGIYPRGWMPRDLADMVHRRQSANLSPLFHAFSD